MKNKLKQYTLILFCFIGFHNSLISQEINENEIIEEKVLKNILIYRLTKTSVVENSVNGNFLKDNTYFWNLIPDIGFRMKLNIKEEDILYPDSTYQLFSIYKKHDTFTNDEINFDLDFPFNLQFDNNFLVALNRSGEMKFISGNFYNTKIMGDFNINDSLSLLTFIKLKTYQYQLKDFSIVKRNKKKVVFKAKSPETNSTVDIIALIKDMDNLHIIWNK